ncbi:MULTISPECIES: GNAT family N-acetyltransferase [unclassified Fusibacter]|uniref:GNAT family N-acetyltransferase n=1 Tax=unclassified Fusibacter TaxID=2624464 RepID=UPI0013E938D8|nr:MULTISPECIES: GNAT family N-acetyltransferase [unclassified Fusibacter]MCK8060288.1 GNAT family N-acetyltransferase [Fusibacter sp. A2]NPE20423.1 GNAT family N-acetyltransferase [Fusibacter sp. A1]
MIRTERLTIRPFTMQDKDFLFELNNDKEVNRFRSSDTASMEYCIDSINDWNEKYGDGLLNVYLFEITESTEPIGLIGIFKRDSDSKAELGYRMMPKFWKRGYCAEAAKVLIENYFSHTNEDEIFAETHPENRNSIVFLKQNRFIEEVHDMQDRGSLFFTSRELWRASEKIGG